jgi:hypothetical protein
VAAGLSEFSRKISDALEEHLITPTEPRQASTPRTITGLSLRPETASGNALLHTFTMRDRGPFLKP